VEFVPDEMHGAHRIEARHLALYTSDTNSDFQQIQPEGYTVEKDENGKITITFAEPVETKILKLHNLFDDRDNRFGPVDRGEFLNKLSQTLRVL